MWFSPRAIPIADSYICRKSGGTAVLFESHVQVLTDAEKREEEMGAAQSDVDKISVRSAQDLTSRFDELAAKYPKFQRLQGVFDVTKLCNAWRSLKVQPAGLDVWLTYKPTAITIPDTYAGIGPEETTDGKHLISGGATTKSKFKVASSVETDRLSVMLEASGPSTVEIELPSSISVEGASAIGFRLEARIAQAKTAMDHGRTEEALGACRPSARSRP